MIRRGLHLVCGLLLMGAAPSFAALTSDVRVENAGSFEQNGVYTKRGFHNGKPYYNLVGKPDSLTEYGIAWYLDGGGYWDMTLEESWYFSGDDTEYPWQAQFEVSNGEDPAPTVSEIPGGTANDPEGVENFSPLALSAGFASGISLWAFALTAAIAMSWVRKLTDAAT
jgi:hypothetical protein